MTEKVFLTNLQQKIAQDNTGEFIRQKKDELSALYGQLKQKMDRGVTPQEFETLQVDLKAVEAAIQVIENCWQNHHKT
ncbi:EscE/YscE/SsaE family type III secretion system needle protein co-chaperone [Algicola sagamiensis]|uniref:EscE/YscE/SsaE family type III secretion system needle protein co-chaperone n=1 Tax=Algicola sagamiensis TaxID=163869 RepID=UPI00037130E4|nr:EscE/YscE/SsaE family type III secretion system needle protein co-chaperone [Algicola sagamiensis]